MPNPATKPPVAIDPRLTLLRSQAPAVLSRVDDVLAVDHILTDLEPTWEKLFTRHFRRPPTTFDRNAFRRGVLVRFFQTTDVDLRSYLPIELHEWPDPEADNQRKPLARYADLVAALLDDHTRPKQLGILLRSRTGSGKTLAARHAYFESMTLTRRLAGWLPVWLSVGEKLPRVKEPFKLIHYLIARSTDVNSKLLRNALRTGPRMFLCLDLNAVVSKHRDNIARAILDFQTRQARRQPHLRHRCVIAYRSTQETDQVTAILASAFRAFDLQAVNPDQAVAYVRNIRQFRQSEQIRLRAAFGVKLGRLHVQPSTNDEELEILRDFASRTISSKESLISTPLLMHFFSLLEGKTLRRVRTLADLYREVLRKLIHREQKTYRDLQGDAKLLGPRGEQRLIAAMTRAALAMFARRTTLLSHDDLRDAFRGHMPQRFRDDQLWSQSLYLPTTGRTLDPAYALSEFEIDILFEGTLLRREADGYAFLHDSWQYYLIGACALRQPVEPSVDPRWRLPSRGWSSQTVQTLRSGKANEWNLVAEFLGGTLKEAVFCPFLCNFLAATSRRGWSHILLRAVQGAATISKTAEFLLQDFRQRPWRSIERSGALASELYARLLWAGLITHSAAIHRTLKNTGRSWLRLLHCTDAALQSEQTLDCDSPITALSTYSDQDSATLRVIVAESNGRVRIWHPATGVIDFLDTCSRPCHAVARLNDKRILLACSDGSIRIWTYPGSQLHIIRPSPFEFVHCGPAVHLKVLPDDNVISAHPDGSIIFTNTTSGVMDVIDNVNDPSDTSAFSIGSKKRSVRAMTTLPDGAIAYYVTPRSLWDFCQSELRIWRFTADGVVRYSLKADSNGECHVDAGDEAIRSLLQSLILFTTSSFPVNGISFDGFSFDLFSRLMVMDSSGTILHAVSNVVNKWTLPGTANTVVGTSFGKVTALSQIATEKIIAGTEECTVHIWPTSQVSLSQVDNGKFRSRRVSVDANGDILYSAKDSQLTVTSGKRAVECPPLSVVPGNTIRWYDDVTDKNKACTLTLRWTHVKLLAMLGTGQTLIAGVEQARGGTIFNGLCWSLRLWTPLSSEVIIIAEGVGPNEVRHICTVRNDLFVFSIGNVLHFRRNDQPYTSFKIGRHRGNVCALSASTSGKVASGSASKAICVWPNERDSANPPIAFYGASEPSSLAWHPTEPWLAVGLANGETLRLALEPEYTAAGLP